MRSRHAAKPRLPKGIRPPTRSRQRRAVVVLGDGDIQAGGSRDSGRFVAPEQAGSVVIAQRDATITEEGAPAEYLFRVMEGTLRAVQLLPDGRRSITDFLVPGSLFGFCDCDRYSQTIEAVTVVELCRYRRQDVALLLASDPRTARHLLHVLSRNLTAIQDRLVLLGRMTPRERLARFLVDLESRRFAHRRWTPRAIELPMTRADIADYLGLSVETVSRAFSALRKEGLIRLEGRNHVTLLRRDVLGNAAGVTPFIPDCAS